MSLAFNGPAVYGSDGGGNAASKSIQRSLDTRLAPVALWTGENLIDSVAGKTLTVNVGTIYYTMVAPGVKGWFFNGATILRYAVSSADLQIDDALTVCAIVNHANDVTTQQIYCEMANAGETLANNILWQNAILSTLLYQDFWEQGAGVNVTFTSNIGVPIGRPFMYHLVRSAAVAGVCSVKLYIDGNLMVTVNGVLKAAKDAVGNIQQLGVGGNWSAGTLFYKGGLASLKIFNYALSDAQVTSEFEYACGIG